MTSVASLLVARVWVFINPCIETVVYEEVPGDFYQDATDVEEVGGFRAWYHTGRYRELGSRVQSIYKTGDKVYDFGCGGAEWNSTKLPVVGVDVNRALLEMGMSKGQLSHMVIAELHKTGIPDQTADIVIISEVFEHLSDPAAVFAEIYRCLKPGGKLLVTVPWDTPCSLFFWVFNVQCFYRGYILGESYYRQRCGHINHFSGALLKKLMRRGGFKVEYLYRFRGFLLYSLASKNVVQL